jgi:hydrogenase maturation protein HypF
VVAVGAQLKNTVALAIGGEVVVSQHVGDLFSAEGALLCARTIDDLVTFFGARPERLACDLHPDYASSRIAEDLAARWRVPLVRVQHHHAHVAACIAEHALSGPVLGLAWDGSGLGTDGTLWGGEALVVEARSPGASRPSVRSASLAASVPSASLAARHWACSTRSAEKAVPSTCPTRARPIASC